MSGLHVRLDGAATERALVRFIHDHVETAGAAGVVLGLSGGLDSAVVAALATRALGPTRVHAFFLPAGPEAKEEATHARAVADTYGIDLATIPVGAIAQAAEGAVGPLERHVAQNLYPRARMMVLYAQAQKRRCVVIGTGNKSELLTGYFTKHGDGGVDLQPLGDLYKTQVRELAEHLEVPAAVRTKPPSAGLWPGQTDESDLGIDYGRLDQVLLGLEVDLPLERVAASAGVSLDEVRRIETLRRRTQHKRQGPLIPKLGIRTVGTDWRDPVMGGHMEA